MKIECWGETEESLSIETAEFEKVYFAAMTKVEELLASFSPSISQSSRSDSREVKKHNTLLHQDAASVERKDDEVSFPAPIIMGHANLGMHIVKTNEVLVENGGGKGKIINFCCSNEAVTHAVLYTAVVYVYDNKRKRHSCRALLDPGSQSNIITVDLVKKMELPIQKVHQSIIGIDQVHKLECFFSDEGIKDHLRRYIESKTLWEEHSQKTVKLEESRRFVVSLRTGPNIILGRSKEVALSRLHSLDRRLNRQPDLKRMYHEFLQEYEDYGHMQEITVNTERDKEDSFYLPHHAVIREQSLTTKLRVVFDTSSKTSTGISLSDKLQVGPNVQQELIEIILHFRVHKFVIIAGVVKMFRQIVVRKEDRALQRILWRTNSEQEVKKFELNRVTYGTACAPFMEIRCIRQLAQEVDTKYSRAKRTLQEDFYMDNIMTGADDLKEAITVQKHLTHLLTSACFLLRKWRNNDEQVLSHLEEEHKSHSLMLIDKNEVIKALGLSWYAQSDTAIRSDRERRIVLYKVFNSVKIAQMPGGIGNHMMLQGFNDASEKGYGVCVYAVECNSEEGAQLMCSKSKVAPLKAITLPRLELNAALVLSKLI
ncbi:hypothetical protein KM043_015747 [Ampulex compressa]|nr:hypothetical protein KM043_015747 [Ampulex compressa]